MAESALEPTEQFQKMTRDVIDPIQALPLKDRAPQYQSAMAEMLPQQIQAGVNLEREKSEREVGVKQAGAEEGQRQTILQQKEMEEGIAKRDKYALPTFTPSQEDLGTYAQLASSIMTMGLLIGAGGKSSAKIAVASMTGMLKGWKEGRKDLYERESKNFEKESARISNIRKDIQSDLDRAMRLWPTKRKDAIALIETARYKAGTESVLGAMLYKGNYDGAMKLLESARKVDESKLKDQQKVEAAKIKADADDRREGRKIASAEKIAGMKTSSTERIKAADIKARFQIREMIGDDAGRRQMIKIEADRQAAALKRISDLEKANAKAAAIANKPNAKAQEKPPAKEIVNSNQFRNELIPRLEDGIKTIRRLEKEDKWGDLSALLGLPYGMNLAELQFKNDKEALSLIRTFALFKSKEFETGGKNLTASEQRILSPLYSADWRIFEAVVGAMEDGLSETTKQRTGYEKAYPWVAEYNKNYNTTYESTPKKSASTGPTLEKFLEEALKLNPGRSKEQLTEYYNNNYRNK